MSALLSAADAGSRPDNGWTCLRRGVARRPPTDNPGAKAYNFSVQKQGWSLVMRLVPHPNIPAHNTKGINRE
jgi:hypothetical protein